MHDFLEFIGVAGKLLLVVTVVFGWLFGSRRKTALRKAAEIVTTPEERVWVDELQKQYGPFVAKESFSKVAGLRGYAPVSVWQRFLGCDGGTKMDMLVTRAAILFFDPAFQSAAKLTVIPQSEVRAVRTNFTDAGTLILKTSAEIVLCRTGRQLGARAIAEVVSSLPRWPHS